MGSLIGSLFGAGPTAQSVQNASQVSASNNQTTDAINQQKNFANAVQGLNGVGNEQSVYNQLQGVASGTGPNPAQSMLAQSTGQNVANQAALMAGQRGANQNVGLMARQAAQQGAATQQQSAGQAATLQANQSLNALSQLNGLAQNEVNQQGNALNSVTSSNLSNQQNLANQVSSSNNTATQMAGLEANLAGSAFGGASSIASAFSSGGEIKKTARFTDHFTGTDYKKGGKVIAEKPSEKATVKGNSYDNDKIPAILSEKEVVLPRSVTMSKNPGEAAKKFVEALNKKKGKK